MEVAWDRPLEEEEAHCCLSKDNFDHWFLMFLCADGLHSLVIDGSRGDEPGVVILPDFKVVPLEGGVEKYWVSMALKVYVPTAPKTMAMKLE